MGETLRIVIMRLLKNAQFSESQAAREEYNLLIICY